jgi:hypothetical protein
MKASAGVGPRFAPMGLQSLLKNPNFDVQPLKGLVILEITASLNAMR